MSQTCTKCNKVVKAFQRLLVYEPVKEPCKMCDRSRPYPSAPPFGTSIKVCSFGEMERMCFPKLCDCPCREMPLCPEAKRREKICMAIYWFATFALFAYLFDSGIFRHPVYTTRLTDSLKEMIGELYTKEEAKEEKEEGKDKEGKDTKGKEGKDTKGKEGKAEEGKEGEVKKGEKHKDLKREYDIATKTYNIANVWNAAVIGAGDILITIVKLPKFVFIKTMEAINSMNEDEDKKGEQAKELKHEKKGEAKKQEPKKEDDKKQEAKDEPKKADDEKQEAKKGEPKKADKKEAKN